jgi:uncharacterized protein (DUF2147 family)
MNKNFHKLALVAVFLLSGAVFANSPVGQWRTIDDTDGKEKSTVEIYEQGGKIYGKISSLREPNDEAGNPKTCTKCTGADLNKPVVGLVIIKGLSADGDEYSGGTIMDPNNGKVYKCTLKVEDGGKKLRVRGYLGFFYRTQYWFKK